MLELHRIPCPKKLCEAPVFLQHGLLGSSADWIVNGNNSLGEYLGNVMSLFQYINTDKIVITVWCYAHIPNS